MSVKNIVSEAPMRVGGCVRGGGVARRPPQRVDRRAAGGGLAVLFGAVRVEEEARLCTMYSYDVLSII